MKRKGRYSFIVFAACMGLLVFVVEMALVQTQASADKVKVKHEDLNAKLDRILRQLSDVDEDLDKDLNAKLDQILQGLSGGGVTFPGDGVQGAPLRYQNNGDGTITDLNTGLTWEEKGSGGNASTCLTDLHGVNSACTWAQATGAWIDAVNAEGGTGFAGHSDWRLPNVKELQSIVDYGRFGPAINPVFNNGIDSFTAAANYWPSTPDAAIPSSAWVVVFSSGFVDTFNKSFTSRVRAVRSPKSCFGP